MQHINLEIPDGSTRCCPKLRITDSAPRLRLLSRLGGWMQLVFALSIVLPLLPVVAAGRLLKRVHFRV